MQIAIEKGRQTRPDIKLGICGEQTASIRAEVPVWVLGRRGEKLVLRRKRGRHTRCGSHPA